GDLARIEAELLVEVVQRDRLEVKDAADGEPAAKSRMGPGPGRGKPASHPARIDADLFVELVQRDRLEVKDAADGQPAAKRRMARGHGREMPASRPAPDEHATAIESEIVGTLGENGQRSVNFRDD